MSTRPQRPTKLSKEEIGMMGMFALGPYIMAQDEHIDMLEGELGVVEACLGGHLGLPVTASMDELLTALQGNPRPKRVDNYDQEAAKARQAAAEHHAQEMEAFSGQNRSSTISDFLAGCAWQTTQGSPTEFQHEGPLPEGYEIYMVTEATEEPVPLGTRPRTQTKARARKIDKTWHGPWHKSGAGGLVVGDAWIHVTGAEQAPGTDETGQE